ncbi:hypothetical protein E4T56_gene10594 [Termitomyces sp. T112]|nr:hypothetical protein E4T56_gene10594 [Termitomyces sp. T112]KAH0579864.1 hypothetical protein H2248_002691 [Termitomyces sp. 'cryptogamus']KNZ77339.1 hypothetical protein J132_05767 [Termitomyces sp. J132]
MPGPSNPQRKRKHKGKAVKKRQQETTEMTDCNDTLPPAHSPSITLMSNARAGSTHETVTMVECSTRIQVENSQESKPRPKQKAASASSLMPKAPFIHDPGNGPRVRDVRAFLSSRFFAQQPALNDPLCAEFAQKEVLEMLKTVLPEEVALILWYNKSRSTSRICPTCHRLYRLGDVLADHIPSQNPFHGMNSSPKMQREQTISGLCSAMCFIAASYSYPNAIKSAWGRTAEELDDQTWNLLNGLPEDPVGDPALTMLMRMTRLDDLGLGRLCLGLDPEDVPR